MKYLFVFLSCLLFGCVNIDTQIKKDILENTIFARYSFKLKSVKLYNSNESEELAINETNFNFEKNNIKINFVFDGVELFFNIQNKNNYPIKLFLDEMIFINTEKNVIKVIPSWSRKINAGLPQMSILIPPESNYGDNLIKINNLDNQDIYNISNEVLPSNIKLKKDKRDRDISTFKNIVLSFKGKYFGILLPIENSGNRYNFLIFFEITKSETFGPVKKKDETDLE